MNYRVVEWTRLYKEFKEWVLMSKVDQLVFNVVSTRRINEETARLYRMPALLPPKSQ